MRAYCRTNHSPMEWEPHMFAAEDVAAIEGVWQCAVTALTHFGSTGSSPMEGQNEGDDWLAKLVRQVEEGHGLNDSDEEEEEPVVTLSRTDRKTSPLEYQDCQDIVLEATRHDPRAIIWASSRLRHDWQFILTMIRQTPAVLPYLPLSLWQVNQEDEEEDGQPSGSTNDFIQQVIQANPRAIPYLVPAELSFCKKRVAPVVHFQQEYFWDKTMDTDQDEKEDDMSSGDDIIPDQDLPALSLRGRANTEPFHFETISVLEKMSEKQCEANGVLPSHHRRNVSDTSRRLWPLASPAFDRIHHIRKHHGYYLRQ